MLAAWVRIAVVTDSREDVDLLSEAFDKRKVFTLYSSFTTMDVIKKANLDQSAAVFINLDDDTQTLIFLLNCRKHFSDQIRFGVVLDRGELVPTFESAGASIVVCKNEMASKLIASFIFEPEVAKFTEDLIASAVTDDNFDIQQLQVNESNPFRGQTYDATFFEMKKRYDAILIGLASLQNGTRVLHKTPNDPALTIEVNDYMILIVSGRNADRIAGDFGVTEGCHDRYEPSALKTG